MDMRSGSGLLYAVIFRGSGGPGSYRDGPGLDDMTHLSICRPTGLVDMHLRYMSAFRPTTLPTRASSSSQRGRKERRGGGLFVSHLGYHGFSPSRERTKYGYQLSPAIAGGQIVPQGLSISQAANMNSVLRDSDGLRGAVWQLWICIIIKDFDILHMPREDCHCHDDPIAAVVEMVEACTGGGVRASICRVSFSAWVSPR
ncbi:hypothetical protein F5Y15DRAFT_147878 [Xylariaceae sp. FL0016]|nr:hypothetical protein F5Y15DRAFT_147878 [Xylariaceae sp. FL0016]